MRWVPACDADERRINVLMVETKAGRQAVRADIFIDCSATAICPGGRTV
jgi:hypothetical protein